MRLTDADDHTHRCAKGVPPVRFLCTARRCSSFIDVDIHTRDDEVVTHDGVSPDWDGVDGSGFTNSSSGLGNLTVGYNQFRGSGDVRTIIRID